MKSFERVCEENSGRVLERARPFRVMCNQIPETGLYDLPRLWPKDRKILDRWSWNNEFIYSVSIVRKAFCIYSNDRVFTGKDLTP